MRCEGSRRFLEQADTALRVSGRVDDLETGIAEIDYVALYEKMVRGRWADSIALG